MNKVQLCFVKNSYDTEFMFSCAKKFNIKTEIIEVIPGPTEVIEVELESDDVEHLYEFCVKHDPQCVETFWHIVEEV